MKSWIRRTALVALVIGVAGVGIIGGAIPGCSGNFESFTPLTDDFLVSGRTLSFFAAVQVDPPSEDTAGPQFVIAQDLNNDGTTDLVSAWNQSQPVQVHLQHRTGGLISFETLTLAGDIPVVSVAGLSVADFDLDGNPDIAVLVKQSAMEGASCLDAETPGDGLSGVIITYLGPTDSDQANQALAWQEVKLGSSQLQGVGSADDGPENGGFTDMNAGDMDMDGDIDLVVAWNSSCSGGMSQAVIFTNQGPTAVRDGTWLGNPVRDDSPNAGVIKDAALGDIDGDGDLDIVATYPAATNANVRWYRNPAIDVPDDYHFTSDEWQTGTIGQVATGADSVRLGDLNGDGNVDVIVRSDNGKIIQWFRGHDGPTTSPVRAIPWQVYTLAEFLDRDPQALAVGDLNGDGQMEVVAGADGGLAWFNSSVAPTVYNQWIENLIVDDISSEEADSDPATTDPNVDPGEIAGGTLIQSAIVADLDDNGTMDIIVTLDRSGLSGLSNDALVWFRSTRRP